MKTLKLILLVVVVLIFIVAFLAAQDVLTEINGNDPANARRSLAQQPAADPLIGTWQGTLQTKVGQLEVYFAIEGKEGGGYWARLSMPAQNVRNMPLQEVRRTDADVILDMSSYGISFAGKLAADGNTITGNFKVGGDSLQLVLRRTVGLPEFRRPQDPVKPYPYEETEVRFLNSQAKIHLSGTLTMPSGPGPFPAVILISGSGPQDRDASLAGHLPFLVLADSLTRRGLAVLRCDDRGVGKSEGDFHRATTLDFAADAQAAWQFLRTQPRIDGRRIGMLGHSEGGIIAPLAAAQNPDIAFLVLLAGPGIRGDRLLLMQIEVSSKRRGAGPEAIRKEQRMDERLLQVIAERATWEAAEPEMKRVIAESLAAMSEAELKELSLTEASVLADWKEQTVDYDWARIIIPLDPATILRQVHCPVLALNGDKDTQVQADVNLPAIEQALREDKNGRFEIKKLPGLNHLFQTARTGEPREYRQIEETISPTVLKLVGDWILRQFETGS